MERRLHHGIPYCYAKTLRETSATVPEGEEHGCRCGRRWRIVNDKWALVVYKESR